VNWYIFFKGWLIPSPPPTTLSPASSLISWRFKNFNVQSGLFPSRLIDLCADSPCHALTIKYWTLFEILPTSTIISIFATPLLQYALLYAHRFRGEPAITKFDKPFTPNHNSSQSFAYTHGFGLFSRIIVCRGNYPQIISVLTPGLK